MILVLLLSVFLALHSGSAPDPAASQVVDQILLDAPTPADLRARLLLFAVGDADSAARAGAWYYAGLSYSRSGLPDSALACQLNAVALRGGDLERETAADLLSLRANPGDGDLALEILGPRVERSRIASERDQANTAARVAWAHYAAGRGDTALARMRVWRSALVRPFNPLRRDWHYRLGLLELEHGDPTQAVEMLRPLAIESNFLDRDVMGMLKQAGEATRSLSHIERSLRLERKDWDALDLAYADTLRARRVTFPGADGFPLSGVVFARPGSTRARATILLAPPGEPFDSFDSLATGLRRAGHAVLVLDARGSGGSVDKACPLPETWHGREDVLLEQCAGDVAHAVRALARETRVDTTRILIGGVGPTSTVAAMVAARDPRVRAVLLVSPAPSPVDRGRVREALALRRLPVFLEIPAADGHTLAFAEALYERLDPRICRLVESDRIGNGPQVFRRDPSAVPRLIRWLDESWADPTSTRPKRPR